MITGGHDAMTVDKFSEIAEKVKGGNIAFTECAHLFSESAQDANKVGLFMSCFAAF